MTASRGAVKRSQKKCIWFLTENPEEKWRQLCFGLEEKKSELGFAADVMTEIKVAAQEEKKKSNQESLVSNSSQKRDLSRPLRIDARRCVSDASQDRWSLGAQCWDPSQIRYSVGMGGGGNTTVNAAKTSDFNPKSSGQMSATRPRVQPSVQKIEEPRQETVV